MSMSPILRNAMYVGEYTIKDILMKKKAVENKWNSKVTDKVRVMFCGTYPVNANGYSKVVYYMAKNMARYDDIQLTIYGFQNFGQTMGQSLREDIPKNVTLHDALATENPRRNGFGEKEIGDYVKQNPQDIIIVFNDSIVTTSITHTIINELRDIRDRFKLVAYVDQVYRYQKPQYIELLNTYFDSLIAFSPYWKENLYKIGIKRDMPIYYYPHGFDHNLYFPIPQEYARTYFNINKGAFCVINLNRNQPRKALDLMMVAWTQIVKRHYLSNGNAESLKDLKGWTSNLHTKREIKLMICTSMDGYWNLIDVLTHECKLEGIPIEYAKKTIWNVENPQLLSDRDVNILYNCADVSINFALGGGWELCTSEALGIGKSSIAPLVGGMIDYLNEDNTILIKPVLRKYHDNKSKGIGGIDELVDTQQYVDAIWAYLSNPGLCRKHGLNGRRQALQHYRWESMTEIFYKSILEIVGSKLS